MSVSTELQFAADAAGARMTAVACAPGEVAQAPLAGHVGAVAALSGREPIPRSPGNRDRGGSVSAQSQIETAHIPSLVDDGEAAGVGRQLLFRLVNEEIR